MQNRLVILSDLWGNRKSDWIQSYIDFLKPFFKIKYYDVCELGGVDTTNYTQNNLHRQFVEGGIDRAVQAILELEQGSDLTILAFSIGGTIAWKAGLLGCSIKNIYAFSATRLRYEKTAPNTNIKLYYGQEDTYQPNDEWFDLHSLDKEVPIGKTHEFYISPACTKIICNVLIKYNNRINE